METIKTKIERISVVEDIFHILKIAEIKKWVIIKNGYRVSISIPKSFPSYLINLMLKDIEQKLMIGLSIYIYNDLKWYENLLKRKKYFNNKSLIDDIKGRLRRCQI